MSYYFRPQTIEIDLDVRIIILITYHCYFSKPKTKFMAVVKEQMAMDMV